MSEGPECCLGLNPDVTGIGVRVALYIQILLGYGVSLVWPDQFAKNARTAYMTAIALIIAAFIQYKTQDPQELSLLDAIVVSMITTMMITFAISSGQTRSKVKDQATSNNQEEEIDPNASFSRFLTQLAFVGLWAGWCLNLWQDPLHFGFKDTLPDCNVNENVIIVLFGRNIKATDERMRAAALVFISIGIVLAFGSLWISLDQILNPFIEPLRKRIEAYQANRGGENKKPAEDIILTRIRWLLHALSFATLIFLIVETEATIRRNDTEKSTTDWSYGQTIALILLLQQIMDVSSTYLEQRAMKKEKEERKAALKNSTPLATMPTLFAGNPPANTTPPVAFPVAHPAPSAAPPAPSSAAPSVASTGPAMPVAHTSQNTGAGGGNP